ncbi:hypothetical protein EYZ11_009387 [Aspergillus tanneri]|uniref:Adenosine deaminase domain-containing protein n=1 Tax=Aspergillus tanneri TaxID=1220188 RepID=A0A4S3J813_9EURO|nr:hypothetical protein EYZ11_009387 [Aspergillus tanneri]
MEAADIEWELEEGIPQVDDPFIQQYLKGRDSLILEEQKQRHDSNLRKTLTPIAATACKIVSKVRDRGLTSIGSTTLNDDSHTSEALGPSEMLHQARDRMKNTELWKILQKMPKGSLLHAHMDTMLDADFIVNQAFTTAGIHICAPSALVTQKDFEEAPFFFQYSSRSTESENEPPLWTSNYKPQTLIPLQKAASSFPNGSEAGFRNWLTSRCIVIPEISGRHQNCRANKIWDVYTRAMTVINSLLSYEPILRSCLRHMFSQFATDGISVFQDELESFKNTEEGKAFYGARVIWTSARILSNKDMAESMMNCILAKKDFPDVICGFDIVGQDYRTRRLGDFVPIMFWFRKLCVEEGVDIPFLFHATECQLYGVPSSHSLFDAVLLGTRRIGDGMLLHDHPLLTELVKEKRILLERCPISSGSRELANSIGCPSLGSLLSRGVPVSLSNDVFGYGWNGLTPELWHALQGPEALEVTDIAMMIENSVRWSCYEDQSTAEWLSGIREGVLGKGVKANRLREWYADFQRFCEWIALEYAELDVDD